LKGVEDLRGGIIRTPLDPNITFADDPLRCLRVIRFTSRYNFQVDPSTYHALSTLPAREGIRDKVSRERIGKEFEKILKGFSFSWGFLIPG